MARSGHFEEWQESLHSAMLELRSGTHREDLTRREHYALGVSEFLEQHCTENQLSSSQSDDMVARFWKFALAEGFSMSSLNRVSAATKGGGRLRGAVLAGALILCGLLIGALL